MPPLLRQLLDNSVVVFFVLAWVAGAIGTALKKAKQTAEQRRRRHAPPPVARPHPEPRQRSPQQIRSQETRSRELRSREITDEMRKILGMEVRRQPDAAAEASVRDSTMGDRRTTNDVPPPLPRAQDSRSGDARPPSRGPLSSEARPARLSHVDSHVGEQMQARSTPASGAVGGHALGQLGGRGASRVRRRRHGASRFVDVSDLGRLIVANEILGPPVALRPPR